MNSLILLTFGLVVALYVMVGAILVHLWHVWPARNLAPEPVEAPVGRHMAGAGVVDPSIELGLAIADQLKRLNARFGDLNETVAAIEAHLAPQELVLGDSGDH